MKQKLLLTILAFVLCGSIFSQTTATQPPNLVQCNNEVFNLTMFSPIILGSQNPNDFEVSYYLSFPEAEANINPISNPTFFIGMQQQIQVIFARVTSNLDQTFAITNFTVSWDSLWLPTMPDISACGYYILPMLQAGQYFTGPNRTGMQMFAGNTIEYTTMLYVNAANNSCSEEINFVIVITPLPNIPLLENVNSCNPYTLPVLIEGDYYTGQNQTGVMLSAGDVISTTTTLYIAAGSGQCLAEHQFVVKIGNPVVNVPSQLVVCSDLEYANFNLQTKIPEISNNESTYIISFHETLTAAITATDSISPVSYINILPSTQTVYVRVENPNGGCFSTTTLQLVVVPCTQNTITGYIRLDNNNTGCDIADPAAANLQVSNTNNGITTYAFTDEFGKYTFTNAQNGTNVIAIQSGLPANYGIATPASHAVVITAGASDEFGENNFCLSPAPFNDAAIYLAANTVIRPGLPVGYFMTVQNQGTTVLSGNATFTYDPSKLVYVSTNPAFASQTANSLTFNFTNLQPSQVVSFTIGFTVQLPGIVNIGDVIQLSANVNVTNDQNLTNNVTNWSQTVVNSFDPNDISVKEGATISEAQADDYLHYTIRFQNTGNADAIDVRLTNELDTNLDWSTFRPIVASHAFQTELVNGQVTFRFDNINLPGSLDNEPASHGYVMYKIKPIAALAVGDVISNQANIFFDFNAPITTNIVTTQIVTLGTPDVAFHNLKLYPNPTSEFVNLEFDEVSNLSVNVFDIQGKLILQNKATSSPTKLDVSALESGMYFVKIDGNGESITKKLIIR